MKNFQIYICKLKINHLFNFHFTLLFLFGFNVLRAQIPTEGGGLIFDSTTFNKYPKVDIGLAKNDVLEQAHSLRKYCPFPRNQGELASCVGWAVGYGALTIMRAVDRGVTDRGYITDQLAHSASYIYNQIKRNSSCYSGAKIGDAIDLLLSEGDCLESSFPSSQRSCEKEPGTSETREAAQFKITNPGTLFTLYNSTPEKIRATKMQIARNNPVIVGMSNTPPYQELRGKSSWNGSPSPNSFLGHAMVVIAYDDRRGVFELLNSFGERWGSRGFIQMSYEDFATNVNEAYVLDKKRAEKSLFEKEEIDFTSNVEISLYLDIQHYLKTTNHLSQVEVKYVPERERYEVIGPKWEANEDRYTLSLDVSKGRYVYLFNFDSRNRPTLTRFFDIHPKDSILTLPDKGYFQISDPGEETIVALISYEPIQNLETKTKLLKFGSDNVVERFNEVFKEDLISTQEENYTHDQIQINSTSNYGEGIAVALFISIKSG